MKARNPQDVIDWFKVLLAFLTLMVLTLFYTLFPNNKDNRLLELIFQTIPSIIAVLVGVIVFYFIFQRRGIFLESRNFVSEETSRDIESIKTTLNNLILNRKKIDYVEEFYDCDWTELITSSEQNIDIIVYYFDTWIKRNRKAILKFFQKPQTTIRIIVADPEIEENFRAIRRLYHNHDEQTIKNKIYNTYHQIFAIIQQAGANANRLQFYLSPHFLNYSIQCFDQKILVISVFEMVRGMEVTAPAFIIDLRESRKLKYFLEKEIEGLIAESRKYT